MTTSSVSQIRVEYTDGSYDHIKLIQEGEFPLYSLDRKKTSSECVSLGAHTNGAIAALLFLTVISNKHTEYSSHDPKVGALLQSWKEQEEKSKTI